MIDYLFLMHNDASSEAATTPDAWPVYLQRLRDDGAFEGGSSIGDGVCVSKAENPPPISQQLGGYIRVRAENFEAACELVKGNPVYEAGGTVEVRELLRD